MNRAILAIVAVLVILGLLSPGDFYINFASRILIAAIFAISLNLLVGYGGLMSLGHSAFLGSAAYTVAWLSVQQGWGHLPAITAALVLTIIIAALFGLLALRAQGIGFLMITLALGQIVWGLAFRWVGVTGGENGITGLKRPTPFGLNLDAASTYYFAVVLVFLLVCLAVARFIRSPFGVSLRGTRDQARRMSALGYNVWLIRWLTYIIAGLLAGVAGILDVYLQNFISPYSLSLAESATVLLMVIVGGSSTMLGPVLGAVIVLTFSQVVSSYFDHWHFALGMLYLIVVIFMPNGILPRLQPLWQSVKRSKA